MRTPHGRLSAVVHGHQGGPDAYPLLSGDEPARVDDYHAALARLSI